MNPIPSSVDPSAPDPSSSPAVTQPPSPLSSAAEPEQSPLRMQPIPPPGEPLQYRAIGLIKGRYQPSEEMFNRGILHTPDGVELGTVLLGRVKHLINKHLDLEQPYLWVVYPRTPDKNFGLQLQIMGVWDPEAMNQPPPPEDAPDPLPDTFSIRGEVIFQSAERELVVVKIRQAKPKDPRGKTASFKLELAGSLPEKGVGSFWDLQVVRQGTTLMIQSAEFVATLPKVPFRPRGGKFDRNRGSSAPPAPKPFSMKPRKKTAPQPRSEGSPEIAPPKPRPPIIDRRKRQQPPE